MVGLGFVVTDSRFNDFFGGFCSGIFRISFFFLVGELEEIKNFVFFRCFG